MDFSPDEGQQAVADAVTSALGRDNTWQALVDVLGGFPALPCLLTTVWGLEPAVGTGWGEPTPGDAVPGFAVTEVDRPRTLTLQGRHRFSRYELRFSLESPTPGRTELHARTAAVFPGLLGGGYRLLVIGSGGHVLAVRRLLAQVARRAERPA